MIRFGVVGSGKIVHEFLEAAGRVEAFKLQTVYSRSMEKAKEMKALFGAEQALDSLEELAACENVDAVYIASPNSLHFSQAKFMLEHGKHVLLEKPAVSNGGEWQSLLTLAAEKNVVLIEAMRSAYDPGFEKIEELLPLIGTVRRATMQYSQYSSRYDAFKRGEVLNAFNPELSNAAVMDIGVYCIYGMVRLFGMPDTVKSNSLFLENGMEAIGTLTAGYKDKIVELLYSKVTDSAQPSEIQGELGTMLIQTIQIPREIVAKLRTGETKTVVINEPENNMNFEIEAFVRMIQGKESADCHQNRSLTEMNVLDLARKDAGIHFPADKQALSHQS